MAALALPVAIAGTVLSFVGQQRTAAAYAAQGRQEQVLSDMQATQEVSSGQRAALEEQRRAQLLSSRALAVAAASGRGASDPTAVRIMSGITQEGAYRAAVDTYDAEEKARYLRMGGQASMNVGQERSSSMNLASYGGLLSSGASLYSKYGMGGPNAALGG